MTAAKASHVTPTVPEGGPAGKEERQKVKGGRELRLKDHGRLKMTSEDQQLLGLVTGKIPEGCQALV